MTTKFDSTSSGLTNQNQAVCPAEAGNGLSAQSDS
jgi:hypothetical protein